MPNRGIRIEAMGDDGGWIVKGTADIDVARERLAAEGSSCRCAETVFNVHRCTPEATSSGWFRIVPAQPYDPCGLDHTHHLVPDVENRQGAFAAVLFTNHRRSSRTVPGVRRKTRREWA